MRKFFTPNITRTGRLVRLAYGLIMLAAGVVALNIPWLAVIFFLSAAFAFFEAARGWCVVRACGIKTKF